VVQEGIMARSCSIEAVLDFNFNISSAKASEHATLSRETIRIALKSQRDIIIPWMTSFFDFFFHFSSHHLL
jgi:hypothetical protein